MNFIGIDPGLHGDIATINSKGIIVARAIPTVTIQVNGKDRTAYNHTEVAYIFHKLGEEDCFAVLEEQQPRPIYYKDKQGKEKKQGATRIHNLQSKRKGKN